MPETPEMEIYRQYLHKYVVGKVISDINISRERSTNVTPEDFRSSSLGSYIEKFKSFARLNVFI